MSGTEQIAAPKRKRKTVLLTIAVLTVLGIAGAGYIFVAGNADKAQEMAETKQEDLPSVYLEIPSMTVDLNNAGTTRYLRIRIKLELSPESVPVAQTAMPRIIDEMQTYLRQLNADELRGSAGNHRLQIELHSIVSSVDDSLDIRDVLIQDMVIQ